MPKPTLFLTRRLPDPIMTMIRDRYDLFSEPPDRPLTFHELQQGFAQTDAAICTLSDRIDAAILPRTSRLKIVANYAVGYNNIDLTATQARGIVVTNTPGVLTDATADLTWALLLAVSRRIVEGDHWIRKGTWPGWEPTQLLGSAITGKTLGIIGMGRIGQAVAWRAQGFRMPVIYTSPRPVTAPAGLDWTRHSLDELLAQADFITLHVPLTHTTRHLMGPRELSLMKPSAFLINTSRGAVIDETALVSALISNTIAGAGLDVYEQEPALHAGLTGLSNTILLPHLGSATLETRLLMGTICLDNIAAVLSGRPALNPVG